MQSTHGSLLERLRSSADSEAWSRFVQIYTPFLFHWAERHGLQPNDRADLVQEVFAQLLKSLPSFVYNPDRSFRAWLFTVVANKWREVQRKRQPATISPDDYRMTALLAEPVDFDAIEYQSYVTGRALSIIRAEFEPKTWQAFWNVVVDGESTIEVGRRLGLSKNAIYLARGRVLRRLREELAGLMD